MLRRQPLSMFRDRQLLCHLHVHNATSRCVTPFKMQSELQSSFQRVEQALQRLTDSIAAYNPDVKAAEELEAADEAVSADLKKRAHDQATTE